MKRIFALGASFACVALVSAGGVVAANPAAADTPPTLVHVTQTTSDLSDALTQKPDLTLSSSSPAAGINISLDTSKKYQQIDGFGAAFTDTSTYLLASGLSSADQNRVMSDLFTRQNGGIGLSFMRVPMGASDFTATPAGNPAPYSYDDNGGEPDPTLAKFSVQHDAAYTIPIIEKAQSLNPDMKLFANTWSPPAWMKTNNSMLGGDTGALRTEYYQAYADYYVRFIQAYEAAGIKVWGITTGNEPSFAPPTYPGMLLPAEAAANLIKNDLSPALKKANLQTKIIGGDDIYVNTNYANTLYNDPDVRNAVYGTAFHCYSGDFQNFSTIANNFPDKPVYETECSTGPTGIAPLNASMMTLASIYNGVSGVQLWNLALDPAGGPKIGQGCNGCTGLVTVDASTKTASYTQNYYQLGQFSRFIRPGATRVGSSDQSGNGSGIWAQGAQNADGSKVLVAHNTTSQSKNFTLTWDGAGSAAYTLPAGATVTFTSGVPSTSQTTVSISKVLDGGLTTSTPLVFSGTLECDGAATAHWDVTVAPGQSRADATALVVDGNRACDLKEDAPPQAPQGWEWSSSPVITPTSFTASGAPVSVTSRSTLRRVAATQLNIAPGSVAAGGSAVVTGSGFQSGDTILLTISSTVEQVASVTADASGNFVATIVVPTGTPEGSLAIRATAQPSGLGAEALLQVTVPPTANPTPTATETAPSAAAGGSNANVGRLATTGAELMPFWGVSIAALTLAVGAALVLIHRRRSARRN